MKTTVRNSLTVLLLALAALSFSLPGKVHAAGVAINSTNFPDATFRQYVSDNFDTNGNGTLSQSEINAVTEISVYKQGISSLKGVEYFTSLRELSCGDNLLSSLDVSSCPDLKKLLCHNNVLTKLDLTKNTKLEELSCSYNALTALDLSKCPLLETLGCDNNSLVTLNISKCTSLGALFCSGNRLTSLNVSGFPALYRLECGNNPLTSLNVAVCPLLYRLHCKYTNRLEEINIYGCPMLILAYTEGDCIEDDVFYSWYYTDPEFSARQFLLDYNKTTEIVINPVKPIITGQPKQKVVKEGTTAKFTVSAMGEGLKYRWQWRRNSSDSWTNCTSATTGYNKATLKVSATTGRNGYQYRCKVTNDAGLTAYTNAATLYVLGIKTQPKSVSTTAGQTAAFQVVATGKSRTYQWQWRRNSSDSWTNCTSATTGYNAATLKVSATTGRNGYQYRCRVKDSAGNTVYTNAVTLKVLGITSQPASVSVKAGKTATFQVTATNAKTYQWQWRKTSSDSWSNCTSATTGYNTATLKVSAEARRNGYQYRCQVKDSAGNTVYSKAATLTVK